MLWFARSARLLVAAALAMGVCQSLAADEYQNYPPPRPLAGWSGPPAPSNGASAAVSKPSQPPRFLPTRYATLDAPPGGSSGAEPAAQQTAAVGRPLPISRQSSDSASPLGGLAGGSTDSLVDAATSLGIVLGLFLLVVWAVRRGMPKGSGLLPSEAVEVLGRASLGGRQQVHLVRCGNKIVMLSVSQSGSHTLAEISDPAEVDRLHSICQPNTAGGALRQFLGHFTGQARSTDYYAGEESHPIDFRHLETSGQRRA